MGKIRCFYWDDSFKEVTVNIENKTLAFAYGLIKAHKENDDYPVRIVISCINSFIYEFDKALSIFFNKYLKKPRASVKNSYQLKSIVDNIVVPENYEFVSLDVVAMYPNLPHYLIKEVLSRKWDLLCNKILPLTKDEFLEGIQFLLNSTYFRFNNKYYKQILGAPIGFCTSPWFGELVMEALETNSLNKLNSSNAMNNFFIDNFNNPVFLYKRYVDDCILLVDKDKKSKILNSFNGFNKYLQFTIEEENIGKEISFLDLLLIRNDKEKVITDWFRKKNFSGRYLNFLSHHPISQKRAIVYCLVDKSMLLADKKYHQKNLDLIKQLLLENNYPEYFIDQNIKKRKKLILNKNNKSIELENTSNNDVKKSHFLFFLFIKMLVMN